MFDHQTVFLTQEGFLRQLSDGSKVAVDAGDCYDEAFVNSIDSHRFFTRSDYANEIYLYFFLKLKEYSQLTKKFSSFRIHWRAAYVERMLLYKALSSASNRHAAVLGCLALPAALFALASILLSATLSLVLPWYFLAKNGIRPENFTSKKVDKVFLIRSLAAFQKMQGEAGTSPCSLVLVDNYKELGAEGQPIYTPITGGSVFFVGLQACWISLRDGALFLHDARKMLGVSCALAVLPKYLMRLPHKAVYESCLVRVISCFPTAKFYTGDKEERFALAQTRICREQNVKLSCLPHGLEYGFLLPGGLCGDYFYCYTAEAAAFLNQLYDETKFVYSESAVVKMFGGDCEHVESNNASSRICFFTEPRDPEVNGLIIQGLLDNKVSFAIKLHPLEDGESYRDKFPHVEQICDYTAAINSPICLARKSTVLLESLYRNKRAISVLVNEKDRVYASRVFPSLSSAKLEHAYTISDLLQML